MVSKAGKRVPTMCLCRGVVKPGMIAVRNDAIKAEHKKAEVGVI